LPEIGPEDGVKAAERIRKKVVKENFAGDGEPIEVTVSVTVAIGGSKGTGILPKFKYLRQLAYQTYLSNLFTSYQELPTKYFLGAGIAQPLCSPS
jgi:GGDEF domain-containing protein